MFLRRGTPRVVLKIFAQRVSMMRGPARCPTIVVPQGWSTKKVPPSGVHQEKSSKRDTQTGSAKQGPPKKSPNRSPPRGFH
jgi:hypothetical protein